MEMAASFISSFLGAAPARTNCPPRESEASHKIGLCPLCFNVIAASSPATPPPAINMVFAWSVLINLYSSSLPRAGFLRQVI